MPSVLDIIPVLFSHVIENERILLRLFSQPLFSSRRQYLSSIFQHNDKLHRKSYRNSTSCVRQVTDVQTAKLPAICQRTTSSNKLFPITGKYRIIPIRYASKH